MIRNTLLAAKSRILDLKKDTRFKYIMVFKNFGPTAGATLSHSHTQLIALPVVPLRVQEEIDGARAHFALKERCIFCDIIQYESEADRRLLVENEHFIVLAPYAPRFSFELAIYPKRHNPAFETTSDAEMESLSRILSETLGKVGRAAEPPRLQPDHPQRPLPATTSASSTTGTSSSCRCWRAWPASNGAPASTSTPSRPRSRSSR